MKITYVVYAHSSPEEAVESFEAACAQADYSPYQQELGMAKYVGNEIALKVEYDTETNGFKVDKV